MEGLAVSTFLLTETTFLYEIQGRIQDFGNRSVGGGGRGRLAGRSPQVLPFFTFFFSVKKGVTIKGTVSSPCSFVGLGRGGGGW